MSLQTRSVRLPDEFWRKLRKLSAFASLDGPPLSVSALVRVAVLDFLQKRGQI
jgi:hypothetical protein